MISTICNGHPLLMFQEAVSSYIRSSNEKPVTYQDLSRRNLRFSNTFVSDSGGFRD